MLTDDRKSSGVTTNVIQNIVLENREKLNITGVLDVLSFDDQIVIFETELGLLTVKGENLRINKLNNLIKDKDEEISFLKSKINELKDTLEYWQDKFNKIILFIHGKIHNWFDKDDKYIDVVNEMYQDNILDDGDINDLDLTSKEKDDFEI